MAEIEAEHLSSLPPVPLLTAKEIILKASNLKRPAEGTIREWTNCFALFTDFLGSDYPLAASKEDAIRFRDQLLKTKKASTVKKVIRYLRSHWQLCNDEELIATNIWDGVVKHLKEDERADKVFDYKNADTLTSGLDTSQQQLYYLLRYTGMRIQEALGLLANEKCLDSRVLTIKDNQYRRVGEGIKNVHSRRRIPISSTLASLMQDLPRDGLLFPQYLSSPGRLNTPSFIRNRLKIGPHTLRHQ